MSPAKEYEFEYIEKYVGGVNEVKRTIEDCPKCGFKLFFTHSPDHGNLIVKETASCTNCDYGQRKLIHGLN